MFEFIVVPYSMPLFFKVQWHNAEASIGFQKLEPKK
jgi:hypothetical protein